MPTTALKRTSSSVFSYEYIFGDIFFYHIGIPLQMSYKIVVLKSVAKFTAKHLCWIQIRKRRWYSWFSVKLFKIFKKICFTEHLRTTPFDLNSAFSLFKPTFFLCDLQKDSLNTHLRNETKVVVDKEILNSMQMNSWKQEKGTNIFMCSPVSLPL